MKTLRMLLVVMLVVVFGNVPYREPAEADEPIPPCRLDAHVIGRVTQVGSLGHLLTPIMIQDEYLVLGTFNHISHLDSYSGAINPLEFSYTLNLFSVSLLEPVQPVHLLSLDVGSIRRSIFMAQLITPKLAQNGNLMVWEALPNVILIGMADGVPVRVEPHQLLPKEQAVDYDGNGSVDLQVIDVNADGTHLLWTEWRNTEHQAQLHLYDIAQKTSTHIAPIVFDEAQRVGFTPDGQFMYYQQSSATGANFYGRGLAPDATPFPLVDVQLSTIRVVPLQHSQILFSAYENGQEKLYLADLAAQTSTMLYSYLRDTHPTYFSVSPDKELVATYDLLEGELVGALITLSDGQFRRFVLPGSGPLYRDYTQLVISPDNGYLLYEAPELTSVSLLGGLPVTLRSEEAYFRWSISPDSRYILYAYAPYPNSTLYQLPITGGEATKIFSVTDFQYLNIVGYSPDGAYWFFEHRPSAEDRAVLPDRLYRWTVGSQDGLCEIASGNEATLLGIGADTLIYGVWDDGIATLYSAPITVE